MKKLFLLVLCFFLVAGSAQAGAGGNSAKQENPRQAGKSSIYFYDVEVPNGNGYGRLVINTDKHTFTFIGQDFTPNQHVYLKTETDSGFELTAKGKSTKSGNLHISGTWEGTLPGVGVVFAYYYYPPAYGFVLENMGGYVANIKIAYSTDNGATWKLTDKIGSISLFEQYWMNIDSVGDYIPEGALVKMKMIVVGGADVTTDEIYTHVSTSPPGYCWPFYDSHGPTWNASLDLFNIQCKPYLDSDYWFIWGE